MSDGALDVALGDTNTGGYFHVPGGSATPPSDMIYSGPQERLSPGTTVNLTEEEARQERLMRPEGRHHLVDIHGLAVFLRRSTRCLSCRAAFCLYVTGKISAQLAAVTQVKITCQKCNYTTSQTLSKPAGVPDSPSPQPSTPVPPTAPVPAPVPPPVPTTPPDTSTPTVRPPASPYATKPRHHTVIRLLKEENLPSELLTKEGEKKIPPLPALRRLHPIEKVWVKEEDKLRPSSPKEDVQVCEEEGVVSSVDPLMTEWCQLARAPVTSVSSQSSSSPPLRHVSNNNAVSSTTVTTTTRFSSRVSPASLQQCGSPISPVLKFKDPQDAPSTTPTIIHRHRNTQQEANTLPKGLSFPSINPALTVVPNLCPAVIPSEGLFPMLSGTPTPYALPIASSILQGNVTAAQDSPQLLQAMEIKQKLKRDLEESLRLVRHMIQLDPDLAAASERKKKKTKSVKVSQESPRQPQVYSAPQEALLGSHHTPAVVPGDLLTEDDAGSGGGGSNSRCKELGKTIARSTPRTKAMKKESSGNKTTRARSGRSRKRGAGAREDDEGNVKKRKKSIKASSSQTSDVPKPVCKEPVSPSASQKMEKCQEPMEPVLYDVIKHSPGGDGDMVQEEWQGEQSQGYNHPNPLQEPHATSYQYHSMLPSTTTTSPDLPSLRGNLDPWGHAQSILGYSTRKLQRKSDGDTSSNANPQTSAMTNLLAALHQATPSTPAPAGEKDTHTTAPTPAIPDHILDTLQRNLSQLMDKNALRQALRSLVRRTHTTRTARSKKYVRIRVGVDEEETLKETGTTAEGWEERDEAGQAATWRFHDLLSSEESDPEDGRLVIDSEH